MGCEFSTLDWSEISPGVCTHCCNKDVLKCFQSRVSTFKSEKLRHASGLTDCDLFVTDWYCSFFAAVCREQAEEEGIKKSGCLCFVQRAFCNMTDCTVTNSSDPTCHQLHDVCVCESSHLLLISYLLSLFQRCVASVRLVSPCRGSCCCLFFLPLLLKIWKSHWDTKHIPQLINCLPTRLLLCDSCLTTSVTCLIWFDKTKYYQKVWDYVIF